MAFKVESFCWRLEKVDQMEVKEPEEIPSRHFCFRYRPVEVELKPS